MIWACLLSGLCYLLPLAIVLVLRSHRDREPGEMALDIPLSVAVDLVAILTLARVFRLETAVVLTRVGWCLGAIAFVWLRRHRPVWPSALGWRTSLALLLACACAVWVSLQLSRSCAIWDRQWHIPLVTALRGQRVPFVNVYEPHGGLYYHYSGNVLAAVLQTLSADTMHASLALSLAHDLMFGLIGATLALLCAQLGVRRAGLLCLVALGTLLAGPATLLLGGEARPTGGYSFVNYYNLSFRPHDALAGLMFVGFAAAVLLRVLRKPMSAPVSRTAPVLLATTTLLVVTDEVSLGMLGLAMGAAWLVEPDVLAPRRATGIQILVALVAVMAAATFLFVGTLAPGAPHQTLTIVPWRLPGFYKPSIPLSDPQGLRLLLCDLGSILAVLGAGAIAAMRTRRREPRAVFAFHAVLAVVSVVALTRVDINDAGLECHRFVSALLFLTPLLGVYWVTSQCEAFGVARGASSLGAILVYAGVAVGGLSTAEWVRSHAQKQCEAHQGFYGQDKFYATNCRNAAGSRMFEAPPVPTYVEEAPSKLRPGESLWYLYAGCRPIFAPGPAISQDNHKLKIGWPTLGLPALGELHRDMLRPDQPLSVICRLAGDRGPDPVCAAAGSNAAACRPIGPAAQSCAMSGAERERLLNPPRPGAPGG